MHLGDTIAAIASPPGPSPRAILRISGPNTPAALAALCDDAPTRRTCTAARLSIPQWNASIPCTLLRFAAPASYTGEDSAELLLPGQLAARAVMDLLESIDGVRAASPGEFTIRALFAGKLDPEQAESVGELISASSASELAAAHRVLSGESGGAYRRICEQLARSLALVEAGIDFTDHEDVVAIPATDLREKLTELTEQLDRFVATAAPRESDQSADPLVLFAGPPNAGKSTLLNRLAGFPRAIVSDTPGTTRDILEHTLDLHPGNIRVRLADSAGLDESLTTASQAESSAQSLTRAALGRAAVVVWCDPTGQFAHAPDTAILARTKADLPCNQAPESALHICAIDGRGVTGLARAIADRALRAQTPGEWAVLPRHNAALTDARDQLAQALQLIEADTDHIAEPELVAHCMRAALDAIGAIVGDITPDDIIGRIQSTFCVGK